MQNQTHICARKTQRINYNSLRTVGLNIVTCFVGDSWPGDAAPNCISKVCVSIYFCIFCFVSLIHVHVSQVGTTWRMRDARTDPRDAVHCLCFALFYFLFIFCLFPSFFLFNFLPAARPLAARRLIEIYWVCRSQRAHTKHQHNKSPSGKWQKYQGSAAAEAHQPTSPPAHRDPTTTAIIWLSSYIFDKTPKNIVNVCQAKISQMRGSSPSPLLLFCQRRYIDTLCAFAAQITISTPTALSFKIKI